MCYYLDCQSVGTQDKRYSMEWVNNRDSEVLCDLCVSVVSKGSAIIDGEGHHLIDAPRAEGEHHQAVDTEGDAAAVGKVFE